MARPSEDELIARHLAPLAGPGGLGLKDDAALLVPRPGRDLVLTVDAIVEGVHFLTHDPPETLAAKALGVNLSDLAAKGAEPTGFLLVLALPDGWTEDWLAAFCAGLGVTARAAACPLLGGDTVRAAGPLTISVTALGEVPIGTMVRRTTARPGDLVCVTGTIGDAALGLALLAGDAAPSAAGTETLSPVGRGEQARKRRPGEGAPHSADRPLPLTRSASPTRPLPTGERVFADSDALSWQTSLAPEHRAYLIDRYRRPQPRLALAPALRAHASAAMDVSDGLAGDLAKLLRASGVTGTLDLDRIPLSPAAESVIASEAKQPSLAAQTASGLLRSARNDGRLIDRIAGGGDDYEILFTLPPERLDAMIRDAAAFGLTVTVIGEVRAGEGPLAVRLDGEAHALRAPSFEHFAAGSTP